MNTTIPAILLVISMTLADDTPSQAVAVMRTVEQCAKISSIIDRDFAKLREAEADLQWFEVESRTKLHKVACWVAEVPLEGNYTTYQPSLQSKDQQ